MREALPARLQAHFDEAINDPNLLASRTETAILDTRMMELIRRIDTGESGELWAALGEVFEEIQGAMASMASADRERAKADSEHDIVGLAMAAEKRSKAAAKVASGLTAMGKLIERGDGDEATWKELMEIVNNKIAVAGSELRRLKDLHQMMTTEQAMALIHSLYSLVKQNLQVLPQQQANEILVKIGQGLKAITNMPEPG